MNTNQLFNHMRKFCTRKHAQYGVIPCDMLNNLRIYKYPVCLIVNSDPSEKSGEHWLAIFIKNKSSPVEFYDSYGLGAGFYGSYFTNFATRLQRKIQENIQQLQSMNSNVCGNYALYFIYKRLLGHLPMSLYCNFSNDYKRNDEIVSKFLKFKCYLFQNNSQKCLQIVQNCTPFRR